MLFRAALAYILGHGQDGPPGEPTMAIAHSSACESGDTCGSETKRVVARIDGALGAAVLVGLDKLSVCRCGSPGAAGRVQRDPWSYADLSGVSIGNYGPMPVILLQRTNGADPLPIMILERGQVSAAIDGLVTLRRLIAASARAASIGMHQLASA